MAMLRRIRVALRPSLSVYRCYANGALDVDGNITRPVMKTTMPGPKSKVQVASFGTYSTQEPLFYSSYFGY